MDDSLDKPKELELSNWCKEMLKNMGLTPLQVQKLYDEYDRCPFCNNYEWYGNQIIHHLDAYRDTCLKKFKEKIAKKRTAALKLVLEQLKQVPDDAKLCNI